MGGAGMGGAGMSGAGMSRAGKDVDGGGADKMPVEESKSLRSRGAVAALGLEKQLAQSASPSDAWAESRSLTTRISGGLKTLEEARVEARRSRIDALGDSSANELEVRENLFQSLAKNALVTNSDDMALHERFDPIVENEFQSVQNEALSTFSIDVDTASYSKLRQYLLEAGQMPPAGAIRIEELINYFQYDYQGPTDEQPFQAHLAVAQCPWQPEHRLVRIALQAKKMDMAKRPLSNLVFLLDVSGSMNEPNKLPLVKESIRMLVSQLGENDRVAMVVYAGAAGVVLESTRGDQKQVILEALDRLSAGGSTNGAQGIQLAYQLAREHFIPGGTNRIVLCTDGDFNVGMTSDDALVGLVEENAKSKIFLTVLGFGMGNTNDSMMEKITNRGNGLYGFVDSELEARRMMVEQMSGSLITVAKDVKIQVEFNPTKVSAYRLIGYENRMLQAADFNNDQKDAGEIGAGHNVTALYEVVPISEQPAAEEGGSAKTVLDIPEIDASRYQTPRKLTEAAQSKEMLVVKLRYKQPEGDKSSLLEFPLNEGHQPLSQADRDFRWSAVVAQFGMMLRQSRYQGDSNWDALLESADAAAEETRDPYRLQTLEMMKAARGLMQK